MAATLAGSVNVALKALLQNSVGLAAASINIEKTQLTTMTSGVGANQWDKVYSESAKSISGNYDVDLNGVLVDALGTVISFARIKALALFADPNNGGNVIIGNGAANQFFGMFGAATHTVNVRPGGLVMFFAPDATAWPVTAATADILRIAPSAGTLLFDWAVVGASA